MREFGPDPKRVEHLKGGYGRAFRAGSKLDSERPRSCRRCLAILNCLAQDRRRLSVATYVRTIPADTMPARGRSSRRQVCGKLHTEAPKRRIDICETGRNRGGPAGPTAMGWGIPVPADRAVDVGSIWSGVFMCSSGKFQASLALPSGEAELTAVVRVNQGQVGR